MKYKLGICFTRNPTHDSAQDFNGRPRTLAKRSVPDGSSRALQDGREQIDFSDEEMPPGRDQ
jgi:hypothetical protein